MPFHCAPGALKRKLIQTLKKMKGPSLKRLEIFFFFFFFTQWEKITKHKNKRACKHTNTPTQRVSAHASGLPGFFHQLDLSQLIISSFEPWAQSMIALSINASMIYFDGASNDKCLACVCVHMHVGVCVCVSASVPASHAAMWLFARIKYAFLAGVRLRTHEHVLVRLCTTVDACMCVGSECVVCTCMCVWGGGSRQGVVNQFRLNWERHVALHRMSFQRHSFISGLLHN